jgi:hypothetical protein
MELDHNGHSDLFAHIVEQGYAGTLVMWQSSLAKVSYASCLRLFLLSYTGCDEELHVSLVAWLTRFFVLAEKHFDRVQSHSDWTEKRVILFTRNDDTALHTSRQHIRALRMTLEPRVHQGFKVNIVMYGAGDRVRERTLFV